MTAAADRKSFDNVQKWHDDVRGERGEEVIIYLVGNKTDLADKRQVSAEEGEAKASELGALFIETSALLGLNIKEMFQRLGEVLPCVEKPKEAAVGAGGQGNKIASSTVAVNLNAKPAPAEQKSGCGC